MPAGDKAEEIEQARKRGRGTGEKPWTDIGKIMRSVKTPCLGVKLRKNHRSWIDTGWLK